MFTKRNHIILLFFGLLFISCSQEHSLLRELEGIESYVQDQPDSAIRQLALIDTARAASPEIKARYTLLTSWARYRLYQDDDDETALAAAAAFFRNSGDDPRLMKTLFLLGYRQDVKGDFIGATTSLSKAEPLTETSRDDFLTGLIYRQLALVFEEAHNMAEACEYYHKAAEAFYGGGYDTHGRYATLREGAANTASGDFEKGRERISEILEYAQEHSDTSLIVLSSLYYADNLIRGDSPDLDTPIRMILSVRDTFQTPLTYLYHSDLGVAYAKKGERAKSEQYYQEAEQAVSTPFEQYSVDYLHFWSSVLLNNDAMALDKAKDVFRYLEQAQLPLVAQSAVNYQRTYFYEQRRIDQLNHELERQKLLNIILLTIISMAIVGILATIVIRRLLVRRRQMQAEMDQISDRLANMEEGQSRSLRASLQSGMQFFNKLAEFKWQSQSYRILPYLDSMFLKLANDDETFEAISAALNESMNGIVARLREQVPSLNKDELQVFCYLAHRFDHMTLCAILNTSQTALNSKIYRIRKKITASNANDAEEFLRAIKD